MGRRLVVTGAALVLLLAACGGDDEETAARTDSLPASQFTLYYLDGEHLRATPATVRDGSTPTDAIEALLANENGHPTEIPPETEVRGVTVLDGTATVDLSREFESGGGSASMQARVAQVVYTLTQWSFVSRVTFELDGEPVEGIGGEGVAAHELTRADLTNVLPPIFIDPPLRWASSPLTVAGSASVFEANVSLRLEADGETLAKGFATAAEGAPGRGAFATMLDFRVEEPTEATLVAFEASANDGSETNVVRMRVRLCPPGNLPC
jgi:germination protein M